jgi:hypothetical protein
LVKEQIDAGARFLREFDKYAPVRVAFWLRKSDRRFGHLYVVSDQITAENFDFAYGEVVRLTGQMPDPYFDLFRVKVLGTDDPLAKAALDARHRYPGTVPIHWRDLYFGGVSADELYIYPLPIAAPVS